MYYISSIFSFLGANNVLQFRLCYYALISIIWVFLYYRYSKYFSKYIFVIYPLLYIAMMATINLSFSIISEHIQAQAFIILLLELLIYIKKNRFDLDNSIIISLCMFFSIGVAFVSIYFAFVYILCIIVLEFRYQLKNTHSIGKSINNMFYKLYKLALTILVPFVVFLLTYLISGNLRNFYEQAFLLNIKVYSKYLGGYGNNPIKPFLLPLQYYFSTIDGSIKELISNPIINLRNLFNSFSILLFSFYLFRDNKTLGVSVFYLAVMSAQRGTVDFHAIPYWAISIIMGVLTSERIIQLYKGKIPIKLSLLFSIVLVIAFTPYGNYLVNILPTSIDFTKASPAKGSAEYYIEKYTNEGDKIHVTLNAALYLETNRLPALRSDFVPWFVELYEDNMIQDLQNTKPKIIIYNPKSNVWGYVFESFAPKANEFILQNYTNVDNSIWINNEFLDEIKDKDELCFIGLSLTQADKPAGFINKNIFIKQSFIANENKLSAISVQLATYARINKCNVTLELCDLDGNVITFKKINGSEIIDNAFYNFEFEPISDSKGKTFFLKIKSDGTEENSITAWMSSIDVYSEGKFYINDKEETGDLCFKLIYNY